MGLEQTTGEGSERFRRVINRVMSPRIMAPLTLVGFGAGIVLLTIGEQMKNDNLYYVGQASCGIPLLYDVANIIYNNFSLRRTA